MQSTAITVDAYLTEVPEDRHAALVQLRALCRQHLVDFTESMTYGMACYSRNGVVEVAFASQKNNIALYILRKDGLDAQRAAFAKSAIGKGCIRYSHPAKINFIVVERLLIETYRSQGPICD